jgi:hypothetical protein
MGVAALQSAATPGRHSTHMLFCGAAASGTLQCAVGALQPAFPVASQRTQRPLVWHTVRETCVKSVLSVHQALGPSAVLLLQPRQVPVASQNGAAEFESQSSSFRHCTHLPEFVSQRVPVAHELALQAWH